MERASKLVARDDNNIGMTPTMVNLLIALLVLVFVGLCCIGALFFIRNRRRSQKEAGLPSYNDKSSFSKGHRLTISTNRHSQALHVYNEKQSLMSDTSSPPMSPESIPEIRITFPEEHDDQGRPKSARVVVVRVGENGVGLEPLEEGLPPYSQADSDRYQSLDLERMGGLKEKTYPTKF
ncbi:MAG: hypothetical protein M1814_003553 [Vezdaea aestivalis]|nr:MAG: hypothetical protein M1814_003553 [Vezdaea aestivalis]